MSRKETPLLYEVKEKHLQESIIRRAGLLGWAHYHPYDSRKSVPGYPDLTLVHPDHGVLWLELKTMVGKISAHQAQWIDLLTAAGQRVYVIRPSDMEFVEALLRGENVESRAA